jgi:hypothetical protein
MMGRLRSTMPTLGAAAALLCALSLGGPSPSHAAPTSSETGEAGRLPCNTVCKAYMAWSERVSAMLHPSQPVAQSAVHHRKLAGWMVHHLPSKTRQPSLNALAQFPVRSDAPSSAATSPAEDAPSGPLDRIADRSAAAGGYVTATLAEPSLAEPSLADTRLADTRLAGTASATNEAPGITLVSATRADAPARGLNRRFVVPLLLALCALSALLLWWVRASRQAASAFPLMSERTFAEMARGSGPGLAITKRGGV